MPTRTYFAVPRETVKVARASSEDVDPVVALLEAAWSAPRGDGPITAPILHALIHSGAFVYTVAEPGGSLHAAAIAFRSTDRPMTLCLHVIGVSNGSRDGGVGRRILWRLASDAFAQGLEAIEWTFDPLVARNAHLYLRVLGARVVAYKRNAYGRINDGVNGADSSDRLAVRWDIRGGCGEKPPENTPSALLVTRAGLPAPIRVGPGPFAVPIPTDIERLRKSDPLAAAAWRLQTGLLLGMPGTRILGVDSKLRYVVARTVP